MQEILALPVDQRRARIQFRGHLFDLLTRYLDLDGETPSARGDLELNSVCGHDGPHADQLRPGGQAQLSPVVAPKRRRHGPTHCRPGPYGVTQRLGISTKMAQATNGATKIIDRPQRSMPL